MSDQFGDLEDRFRGGRESDEWIARVRIPALQVAIFTRHLGTLLKAGVSILKALSSLAEQSENPQLAETVATVRDSVSSGNPLSASMAPFAKVFPPIYIHMLRVGEQSGALVLCLERLADWLERDSRLVQRVKSGLSYPLFVLSLGVLITGFLFYFVLPPFLEMLIGLHIPLPWSTRLIWICIRLLHSPSAWLIFAGAGLAVYRYLAWQLSRPDGKALLWNALVKLPVVGKALRSYSMVRTCAAGSVLMRSGCDVRTVWTLALEVSGDPRLAADSQHLVEHLMNGGEVARYFASRADLYPPVLAHLLAAGEEVGHMGGMMENLHHFYDQDVDSRLDAVTALLQPLMLMCVSGLLTFSMLAIFMPLYSYLDLL